MSLLTEAWDFVRNARLVRNAREYSSLIPDYLNSFPSPTESAALFASVHTYVMFIGLGRSGTTLVGALLDAHPRMVIARQLGALKYLWPVPFSRERIFRLLVQNSLKTARDGWPGGGGYSHAIAGQMQGSFDVIEVIGDKSRSAQSLEWFASRPALLSRLADTTRARIRMLHVIRNPYDTIATRSRRRRVSPEKISREYFALTGQLHELNGRIASHAGLDIKRIPVHLEDLILDPKGQLAELCNSLGVSPSEDYLEACAGIVYRKPSEPRRTIEWPAQLVSDIQHRMQEFPHLQRYSLTGDD
jgi:hypothetical protein